MAQVARGRFVLPSPVIRSSPRQDLLQLVHLPTWLWIDRSVWHPYTATASVPGESVTATATPAQVAWVTGDGGSVTCHGPGTPYGQSGNPQAASPDCGHTFQVSSAGQPGEAYRVTATITWAITWAGGGQAGTLPPLTTSAAAGFRVAEAQGLDIPPGA
ncbi:hypothetical protein FHU30_004263 [Actinomadura rupiterrae]|nr:hypothetical protein [Actinomadura rupiterrae]